MSFLLFLLLITLTLTNIVIGFYLAILLGYGPVNLRHLSDIGRVCLLLSQYLQPPEFLGRTVESFWERVRNLFNFVPIISFRHRGEDGVEVEAETTVGEKHHSGVIEVDDLPDNFDAVMEQLSMAPVGDLLYDDTDQISELSPMQELFDDDLANVLMEQGTEAWLANEKHVETSLLKLNTVMMKSGKFASELDWRIRSAKGHLTPDDIRQFRDEMKDDCLQYLDSQASITEQMKERLDEFGELKNLAEEVEFANMEQSSQIETTVSNLDRMDLSKNPEELGGNLIKELSNLRVARHRLRDMQDRTFMDIVFYEKRLDTIPQQLYFDEKFGVRGRIGLEAAIYEWWKQGRHQTRQITFALLDFVRFGDANLEHGIFVCDHLIKDFGRLLTEHFDSSDLIGIYSGNCFMVATVNMGPKKTVTEIERIRQRCEKTTYLLSNGDGMKLFTTCAITEALANQSQAEVLGALEMTLKAAKKAGRNHTYTFVPGPLNKPPELVEAPDLGEIPREVQLDTV